MADVSSRRVYASQAKEFAKKTGLIGVPLVIVIFLLLYSRGDIFITGYYGNYTCAGTKKDPCYAYINFTAKTDIFIYPMPKEDITWTLKTNEPMQEIIIQRSWGNSWRTIDLNNTWDKNVKYAIKFTKGQNYQLRFIGYKINQNYNVNWAFFNIFGVWKGVGIYEYTFYETTIQNHLLFNYSEPEMAFSARGVDDNTYIELKPCLTVNNTRYYASYLKKNYKTSFNQWIIPTEELYKFGFSINEGNLNRNSIQEVCLEISKNSTPYHFEDYKLLFNNYKIDFSDIKQSGFEINLYSRYISIRNLSDASLYFDPTVTFSTGAIASIALTPLNNTQFAIAYADGTNAYYMVYDTNGTNITSNVTVGSVSGGGIHSLGISAFNSTHVVIIFCDRSAADATTAIYNSTANLIAGPTDLDTDVGVSKGCSVSTFNRTHYVACFIDLTDADTTCTVRDIAQTQITAPFDVDLSIGSSEAVAVDTFNNTHFVVTWISDETLNTIEFATYNILGTLISGPTVVDTIKGTQVRGLDVTTFNQTHFAISYFNQTPATTISRIYDIYSNGYSIHTVDSACGSSNSAQNSAVNSTEYYIAWLDAAAYDRSTALYTIDGDAIVSERDAETQTDASVYAQEVTANHTSINLGLCHESIVYAYFNSTTQGAWKTFNKTDIWDGTCGEAPPPNNPPQLTNPIKPTDPSTYSPGATYKFNITVTDPDGSGQVHTVFIEFNATSPVSSTLQNYSMANSTGAPLNWTKSFIDLPTGKFVYKFFANDTSNAWNNTTSNTFTINPHSSSCNLLLNGTDDDKTYSQYQKANFSISVDVPSATVNLSSNYTGWVTQTAATPLNNITNLTTIGTNWNMTGYYGGTSNYSSCSETHYFSVQAVVPTILNISTPTWILYPIEDSFVSSYGYPYCSISPYICRNSSQWNLTRLEAGVYGRYYDTRSWLKFNKLTLGYFDDAYMCLYRYNSTGINESGSNFQIYYSDNMTWNEKQLTWDSMPSWNSAKISEANITNTSNWVCWDVKDAMKGVYNYVSLMIRKFLVGVTPESSYENYTGGTVGLNFWDLYVNQTNSTFSYNTSTKIYITNLTNANLIGYLEVKPNGTYFPGSTINNATLNVYVPSGCIKPKNMALYGCYGVGRKENMNYITQPMCDKYIASSNFETSGWKSFDVSKYLQEVALAGASIENATFKFSMSEDVSIGYTGSSVVTTNNNSQTSWYEYFNGDENKTFWISLPKSQTVESAYLNLSGFVYGVYGDKWNASLTPSGYYVYNGDDSYIRSSIVCSNSNTRINVTATALGSQYVTGPYCAFFFALPTGLANASYTWDEVYWKLYGHTYDPYNFEQRIEIYFTNVTSSSQCDVGTDYSYTGYIIGAWQNVDNTETNKYYNSTFTENWGVPITSYKNTGWEEIVARVDSNRGVNIAPYPNTTCEQIWDGSTYLKIEIRNTTANNPNNPFIDVGADGDAEWSYSGSFLQSNNRTGDFSSEMNVYLSDCTPDANGYCDVPIILHSDTIGKILISDINVTISGSQNFTCFTSEEDAINKPYLQIGYSYDTRREQVFFNSSNSTGISLDPYVIANVTWGINGSSQTGNSTIGYTYTPKGQTSKQPIFEVCLDADSNKDIYLNLTGINLPSNFMWVGGKINTGIKFDGVDDYIKVLHSSTLNFGTGNFSISAWIKTSVAPSTQEVVMKTDTLGLNLYELGIYSGLPSFYISDSSNSISVDATKYVNDSNWHLLVGVREGNTLKIYIDGIMNDSASGASVNPDNTGNLTIGIQEVGLSYLFKGTIDEVRIYNRALNSTEVLWAYQRENAGLVSNVSSAGLKGNWKLDEGLGITAVDSSGNNNHGTLVNFDYSNIISLPECVKSFWHYSNSSNVISAVSANITNNTAQKVLNGLTKGKCGYIWQNVTLLDCIPSDYFSFNFTWDAK